MTKAASKLAINGGEPAIPAGVVKTWPEITEDDKKAVIEVLEADPIVLTVGPKFKQLGEKWAEWLGVKHCLYTNSGTAALHMALAGVGLQPGDEVITTAMSWSSSCTCIFHHNGIPMFADIEEISYNIDPNDIEKRITSHTKALLPVHLYGGPADMDPIMEIAKKRNLMVVEDACQSHGAEYKGRKVGTIGDAAAFSLNQNKNLPGGEGGLFVTNSDEVFEEAARLWQFGEVHRKDGTREYNVHGMGWMYRGSELKAAFALSLLNRFDETLDRIRENSEALTEYLSDIPGLTLPRWHEGCHHVYNQYVIRFDPKPHGIDVPVAEFTAKVRQAIAAEGVRLGRADWLLPGMTLFQNLEGYGKGCPWNCPHARPGITYPTENDYPATKAVTASTQSLTGNKPPNTPETMKYYSDAFHKVFDQLDQLF